MFLTITMKKTIAVFGGTFNPIHNGHLLSGLQLIKEIKLKRLFFLLNNIPPHKVKIDISTKDRLIMLKLALREQPYFKISYIEVKRQSISYTFDTLKIIRKKIGKRASLIFILGDDNISHLHTWENWNKFLKICHMIFIPRKKNNSFNISWMNKYIINNPMYLHKYSNGYIFFSNIKKTTLSSTQVRCFIKKRKSFSQFVPKEVLNYIKKKNLYVT